MTSTTKNSLLPPTASPRRSVAELIILEAKLSQELTLNSIQLERTVEIFQQRIAKLAKQREAIDAATRVVREDLRRHSLMAELLTLPSELNAYVKSIAPPCVSSDLYERSAATATQQQQQQQGSIKSLSMIEQSLAISSKTLPTVVDNLEFQKCIAADRILVSDAPKKVYKESGQGRLQELHTATGSCSAFIPVVGEEANNKSTQNLSKQPQQANRYARRPATAHLAICEASSLIDIGRCVISKKLHEKGDLLFVEFPFLTLSVDSEKATLSGPYREILDKILSKREVFEKKMWDSRLCVALISFWCECEHGGAVVAARLRSAVASLCCPLQSIDADKLTSLCEYAHFVHAALPAAATSGTGGGDADAEEAEGGGGGLTAIGLYGATEDDIVSFFVSFQTNALAHGQRNQILLNTGDNSNANAFNQLFIAGATAGEEKHSLFSFASLIQHSCDPNAVVAVRSLTDVPPQSKQNSADVGGEDEDTYGYILEVRALRPIGVGEAVSIAYCNLLPPTIQRRKVLRNRYFFDCMCPRCTKLPDYSRRFIDSNERIVCPVGEGSRWMITASAGEDGTLVKPEDNSGSNIGGAGIRTAILPFIKMEARFLESSSTDDSDSIDKAGSSLSSASPSSSAWALVKRWSLVFKGWSSTNEEGYARLAPEHFAVVTAACMYFYSLSNALSSSTASSPQTQMSAVSTSEEIDGHISELTRYVAGLLVRTIAIDAPQWLGLLHSEDGRRKRDPADAATAGRSASSFIYEGNPAEAIAQHDFSKISDHVVVHACVVPVLEAAASALNAHASYHLGGAEESSGEQKEKVKSRGERCAAAMWYLAYKLLSGVCQQASSERALRAKLQAAQLL